MAMICPALHSMWGWTEVTSSSVRTRCTPSVTTKMRPVTSFLSGLKRSLIGFPAVVGVMDCDCAVLLSSLPSSPRFLFVHDCDFVPDVTCLCPRRVHVSWSLEGVCCHYQSLVHEGQARSGGGCARWGWV